VARVVDASPWSPSSLRKKTTTTEEKGKGKGKKRKAWSKRTRKWDKEKSFQLIDVSKRGRFFKIMGRIQKVGDPGKRYRAVRKNKR